MEKSLGSRSWRSAEVRWCHYIAAAANAPRGCHFSPAQKRRPRGGGDPSFACVTAMLENLDPRLRGDDVQDVTKRMP
ncbi:MAG: hypothetical protein EOO78_04625 [Oxalobacteraceae bacterium]|nr:MAG: hypothetical protein EOO78_04625 [Oxalobacteraceae bacterium]